MFKHATFEAVVILKSIPDNQQHVQLYNMISLFHDILSAKTLELDENRLQTAQALHNLYQKMMYYNQNFVCAELRQIVYELFDVMFCKKVLYMRPPNEKDIDKSDKSNWIFFEEQNIFKHLTEKQDAKISRLNDKIHSEQCYCFIY